MVQSGRKISVVVPALDEAAEIERCLQALQPLREEGHEIILVDGGSRDETPELARPLVDRVLFSPPGRSRQMNVGAACARGDVLWFVHADTQIPETAGESLLQVLNNASPGWGYFAVRLSGSRPMLRVVEALMNLRSRWSGIATGDQGLFVTRGLFEQVGGFPKIPLMEDVGLSKRLKAVRRPHCVRARLVTFQPALGAEGHRPHDPADVALARRVCAGRFAAPSRHAV